MSSNDTQMPMQINNTDVFDESGEFGKKTKFTKQPLVLSSNPTTSYGSSFTVGTTSYGSLSG